MSVRITLMAALLIAFSFFNAFGNLAANSDTIFRATFSPDNPVSGETRIELQNNSIAPVFVYGINQAGARLPIPFELVRKDIHLDLSDSIPRLSGILVAYRNNSNHDSISRARVFSGESEVPGNWGNPQPQTTGVLTDVTDSLAFYTVAVADTHTLAFTTTTSPLADSGTVWAIFPDAFDIASITDVVYSDDDTANDGSEPFIESVDADGNNLLLHFGFTGNHAAAGSRISLKFWPVYNGTVAQSHTLLVFTTKHNGEIDNGPADSAPFTLLPGPFHHIKMMPDTAVSIPAGAYLPFSAGARDIYENPVSGIVLSFQVTPDSCGSINGNSFRANKLGDCYIKASGSGITDSTGRISVIPGPLERFYIFGYPESDTAGSSFGGTISVGAFDGQNNRKRDYRGSIWFYSDPIDSFPHNSANPYTFTESDAGMASFPGSSFSLNRSGIRNFSVTNGSITVTTSQIRIFAAPIFAFTLLTDSLHVAGETFYVDVAGAVDRFNNMSSGEIVISDSIGGGLSPNGIPPGYNRIIVTSGSGRALQTVTNAIPTALKGRTMTGGVVNITRLFQVAPGSLSRFALAGYPDQINAGEPFIQDVRVIAYDLYGNIKTNYDGWIYFECTDTLASLPHTSQTPFHFLPGYSGNHAFDNSQFTLRGAGTHFLTVTDSIISTTSQAIAVLPGPINLFTLWAPPNAVAGQPFGASITNARDAWGNRAGGVVVISDSSGGGPSPNGTQPIYSPITVVNGEGNANQTLYNTVSTVLKGAAGSVVQTIGPIEVAPGTAGRFDFQVSSPQVDGFPFFGTAALTAFDRYGNLKTDYNALADTVFISSLSGGQLTANILRLPGDFVQGAANLVSHGTAYSGLGGQVTLQAASQSGATGISNQIEITALSCAGLNIEQSVVSHGDTATGRITVANAGGAAVNVTDLYVIDSGGRTIAPITNPVLPFSLPAGDSRIFNVSVIIPGDYPNGNHPLTAAVRGNYSTYTLNDTLPGFPDSISIQSLSLPVYVDDSLEPDTLSSGNLYALSLRVRNGGSAGLALFDSSYLIFSDGVRQYRADITSAIYLPPGQPQGVPVTFDSTRVADDFAAGSYSPAFHYFGLENGYIRSGVMGISDAVVIQSRAALAYVAGSLNIDSLAGGQLAAFAVQIQNGGNADFVVRHESTRLFFSDGAMEFTAPSDTATGRRVDVIGQGSTTFHFGPVVLPTGFLAGTYRPNVTLAGWQNGQNETVYINTLQDSVRVLSSASIRLDSVYVVSQNAPFVNISQACSLKVIFENTGDEAAVGFNLRLSHDGAAIFPDSTLIPRLNGHERRQIFLVGYSGPQADPDEIFTTALSGGAAAMSGNPVAIGQPLDNTAILITEWPAALSISQFDVTSPPEALDDTISTGQPITISATIRNLGQAGLTGSQRIIINAGDFGWTIDHDPRDFELGIPVVWQATAPSSSQDSAVLSLWFASDPRDANDGSRVIGDDSTAALRFVVNTSPFISHSAAISGPSGAVDGVVSTNQTFIVSDTLRPSGIYSRKGAMIRLPEGVTTQDSLTKYPQGDLVSWQLRAPQSASSGSILVTSWVIDHNTGDSSNAVPVGIPISTVQAASLRLSARIVSPHTALDGIVEPGGYFGLEALVQNSGQAQVGVGQVSLNTGRADMVSSEDPLQSFTPGAPVTWNISLPQEEVALPIPISVRLASVPIDENTMAPANVTIDSAAVTVVVRELYPRLVLNRIDGYSGSVFKGQNLAYLNFEFNNNEIGGDFPIAISGFNLGLRLNPEIPPTEFLASASIISDSGQFTLAGFEDGYLRFISPDSIYLGSAARLGFTLMITLAQSTPVSDFSITLDNNLVDAVIIENGVPALNVEAISARGEPISWQSDPTAVVEQSFAASVSSYPNPFSPAAGGTRIGYYLAANSDLEIKVFTLLGELVWTKAISSADPLGTAGLHTGQTSVQWDGKNDIGREIRSGVYICLIRNLTSGEEEKFKIAIVK